MERFHTASDVEPSVDTLLHSPFWSRELRCGSSVMVPGQYFYCRFLCETALVSLLRNGIRVSKGLAGPSYFCAGLPRPASGANRSADFVRSCGVLTLRQKQTLEIGRGIYDSCFHQTSFALPGLDRPDLLDH